MQHKDRLAQLLQALDEMNERIIDIKRFLKTTLVEYSKDTQVASQEPAVLQEKP